MMGNCRDKNYGGKLYLIAGQAGVQLLCASKIGCILEFLMINLLTGEMNGMDVIRYAGKTFIQ